jgi:outer membrane protein assembly factor BamB
MREYHRAPRRAGTRRGLTLGAALLAAVGLTAGCSSGGGSTASAARPVPTSSTPSGPPPTTSSAPSGPPEAGTILATYEPAGQATVTANPNGGFAILDNSGDDSDDSQALFYDASGNRVGKVSGDDFDADCGLGDAGTGSDRVAITEHVHKKEAAGIHAAKYSLRMQALDPSDGAQLWQKTLIRAQTGEISCSGDSSDVEQQTANGKWVLQVPDGAADEKHPKIKVVDTASGKNRVDMKAVGLLGDYVLDGDPTGHSNTDELTDPATGTAHGSLTGDQEGGGTGISFDDSWVLAGRGLLSEDSSVGLNPAGDVLMAEVGSGDSTSLKAYQLPSAKTLWSASVPDDTETALIGDAGGKLLVDESGEDGDENDKIVALDDSSGKEAWHVPAGDVCGLTGKQLMLSVNDQIAVIDMQTGKQLSYSGAEDEDEDDDSAEQGGECPDIRAGGIAVSEDEDGDGITITQKLEP